MLGNAAMTSPIGGAELTERTMRVLTREGHGFHGFATSQRNKDGTWSAEAVAECAAGESSHGARNKDETER